jgi:dipeptidyl-peptidase-3
MRGYKCTCCGSIVSELSETPAAGETKGSGSTSAAALCHGCEELPEEQIVNLHTIPTATPICALEADETFKGLTDRERWYAYWIARASWDGSLICLAQTSPESVSIFCLLMVAFRAQPVEELALAALAAGLTEDEVNYAMTYAAAFLCNMGNYKSMGDSKFVPQIPLHRLRVFLECSKCDRAELNHYLTLSCPRMYSLPLRHRQVSSFTHVLDY